MNIFEKITESPEAQRGLLRAIPAIETPWDEAFHRLYCFSCSAADCDAFAALSQEFERSSRILAEEWAQTSALAKIAVISESND